ncbi:MAG: hypothetical protein L6Q29_00540 [Candidatus Pacebacteria bacterium]|nr:hypothetical protein [Candidatus Paceibacterota bacterium]NUQ57034.1 hypothetical protein [Candidatus Paceibacter sp.]
MANKKQSAAYAPKVRRKWYFLVEKLGKTVDEVCGLYFISRKTYYKWKNIDCGSIIYASKKERPETKIKGELKIFISEQKLRLNYGPKKMRMLIKRKFNTDVSATAIYKFYKKKNLIRRSLLFLKLIFIRVKIPQNNNIYGTLSTLYRFLKFC